MDEAANFIPLLLISVTLDLVQWLLGCATSLYRLSLRDMRKSVLQ